MTACEFGDTILVPFLPTALESAIVGWREAGLLKPSVLKPVLATIERSLVLRRLGRLAEPDRRALRELLSAMLG